MGFLKRMTSVEDVSRIASNPENLTAQHILQFYNAILNELQNCASIKPASNSNNLDLEETEEVLLSIEADLLKAAGDVELQRPEDLMNLIDVWEKACRIDTSEHIRPSDRIALNIFRQLITANAPTN